MKLLLLIPVLVLSNCYRNSSNYLTGWNFAKRYRSRLSIFVHWSHPFLLNCEMTCCLWGAGLDFIIGVSGEIQDFEVTVCSAVQCLFAYSSIEYTHASNLFLLCVNTQLLKEAAFFPKMLFLTRIIILKQSHL